MAFFGDQSVRLLRENWSSATALAEELYAMMSPNAPTSTNGPVNISQPVGDAQAPFTIDTNSPTGPVMQFNHPDGSMTQIGADGAVGQIGADGQPGKQGQSGGGGVFVPVWG